MIYLLTCTANRCLDLRIIFAKKFFGPTFHHNIINQSIHFSLKSFSRNETFTPNVP